MSSLLEGVGVTVLVGVGVSVSSLVEGVGVTVFVGVGVLVILQHDWTKAIGLSVGSKAVTGQWLEERLSPSSSFSQRQKSASITYL